MPMASSSTSSSAFKARGCNPDAGQGVLASRAKTAMDQAFEGKVAIITGGASGIGRAAALRFAAAGARVCVADVQGEKAAEVAAEIAQHGGQAFGVKVDVRDETENQKMVEQTVARLGAVHCAFLNAGIGRQGSILEGKVEDWDLVVSVNLRGVYLGMRAVAPAISVAGGGTLVVTASVAGLRGGRNMAAYFASKHAVLGLMKAAAAELAPQRIRVNAICPGVIDTPILGPMHSNEAVLRDVLGPLHLLGRVGQPQEVADLVAFLCSEQSTFITGAAVPIDGGMTASVMLPGRGMRAG
jgi:NAD(P)-dependent dehydrogenase (short-subunit alcohol dehydrogenase family)